MPAPELSEYLEDELFRLRDIYGQESFPRTPSYYLDEWCEDDKAWLRKYYPAGESEAVYDITPATEKVLVWLESLFDRTFVGTESRVLTVLELLRQIVSGTDADPQRRLEELEQKKAAIQRQIDDVKSGRIPLLDETQIRDRFQLASSTARELLSDFRAVQENFRKLDRQARELIALWDGSKGALVEQLLDQREAIAESDQGKNFRAFWDFLMNPDIQDEFDSLLKNVYAMDAVKGLANSVSDERIHYLWIAAGEQTQRTVALLSQQLRRFLDDQVWLENRRIMGLIKNVETKALRLKAEKMPKADFMELDSPVLGINLFMERQLHERRISKVMAEEPLEAGTLEESDILYSIRMVDKQRLLAAIHAVLENKDQASLAEVLEDWPLQEGLAELVAYMNLESSEWLSHVDEEASDKVNWQSMEALVKIASMERLLYRKKQ